MTKKEAIEKVFGNSSVIMTNFWHNNKIVKEILKAFSKNELNEIEKKRIARSHLRRKLEDMEEAPKNLMQQLKRLKGFAASNGSYSKVIIEGNDYLYFASPVFKHEDYNKSCFAENTERNRKVAAIFNEWLLKH